MRTSRAFFIFTSIYILEPYNIILTKITTRLNLNDNKRLCSWITETMFCLHRNINGLIFLYTLYKGINSDLGHTTDHYPVFSPVMMELQRKLRSGIHNDSFHLKPWSHGKGLITSPWTINQRIQPVFLTIFVLKTGNNVLDILHSISLSDKNRILGLNNREIFHVQRRDQTTCSIQIAPAGIFHDDVTCTNVSR